jgi:hypothetical protein
MGNEVIVGEILKWILFIIIFYFAFKEGYKRKKEGTFFKFSKTDKILGIATIVLFLFLASLFLLL